jgi:hypothetical protein
MDSHLPTNVLLFVKKTQLKRSHSAQLFYSNLIDWFNICPLCWTIAEVQLILQLYSRENQLLSLCDSLQISIEFAFKKSIFLQLIDHLVQNPENQPIVIQSITHKIYAIWVKVLQWL